MNIYTKQGLREHLLSHPKMPNSKARREQTLSECEYMVNSILYEQFHHEQNPEEYTRLNREILRQVITYRKEPLVNTILSDFIEVDNSWKAGAYSKGYRLNAEWRKADIIQIELLSKDISRRIEKARLKRNKYYLKFPEHAKIIFNLQELRITKADAIRALEARSGMSFAEAVEVSKSKAHPDKKRIVRYLNDLETAVSLSTLAEMGRWEEWLSKFNYHQSPKVNRVFNTYTDMFKELRRAHEHKSGKELVSIDMRNALPTFLGIKFYNEKTLHHIYKGVLTEDKASKEEGVLYVATFFNLLEGKFYSNLQEWLKQRHYKHGFSDYKEFKQKVLSFLFSRNLPEDAKASIHLAMEALHPEFYKWIRDKKQENYKSLSHLAMKMESSVFIGKVFGEYAPLSNWAFPTHDELTVMQGDEVATIKFLENAIFELYDIKPTSNTFRIEREGGGENEC